MGRSPEEEANIVSLKETRQRQKRGAEGEAGKRAKVGRRKESIPVFKFDNRGGSKIGGGN